MKSFLIGMTLDWVKSGDYSRYPSYALRQHYADAISQAGGIPVALPYDCEAVEHYADQLDGLLVTGGNFDVDPALYGQVANGRLDTPIPHRTQFEFEILKRFLQRDKPILGICGGQQLLNVVAGGTLIQHIPDRISNPLLHEQPNPRHEVSHTVTVMPQTQLHAIVDTLHFSVNSAHHQAVDQVAPGFVVNAVADDGVIEGIESSEHRFCLGVQWHPEFLITPQDQQVFKAFLQSCAV